MELKYKIYDKTSDKIFSSDEYHIKLDLTNKMVWIAETPINYENEIEAIILPYTGVKDINKKESYLGDILKKKISEWLSEKQREKCEKEKSFCIVKKEPNSNNMYLEYNFNIRGYWEINNLPITHIDRYEIVGNIYTDLDMIKKEE